MKKFPGKSLFYGLAILVLALGAGAIFVFGGNASELFDDASETTGWLAAGLFGLLMLLFFVFTILKRKWYPPVLKRTVVFVAKHLNGYHVPLTVLGAAVLAVHALTGGSETAWQWFQGEHAKAIITGTVCTSLMVLSVGAALVVKKNRTLYRRIHVVLAFAAVIALAVHLID